MAHPTITLLYNSTANDVLYNGTGATDGTFYPVIAISGSATGSGIIVFTGGGIDDVYDGDPIGTRSATLRPESGNTTIPKTFIEQEVLHQVSLAGQLDNRFVFAAYVNGSTTSELYLEVWDDDTHQTCVSPVLSGTASNGHISMIRAITTTTGTPGAAWDGTPLRGYASRIGLSNSSAITDSALYFNIYVRLPYDTVTFVNTPVLSLRYLYS